MGESTILKVTVNQEEVIFLETMMTLEKKAGEHTVAFFTGILEPGKDGQEYCIVPEAEIEIFDQGMEYHMGQGSRKCLGLKHTQSEKHIGHLADRGVSQAFF